jgi:hypothetical protein
LKQIIAEEKEH